MGHPADKATGYHEYIIVGAGPAGVQAAYFLEKFGRDYMVIEMGNGPCTFFKKYPRHRKLISVNKRFNGFPEDDFNLRHDWNSLLSDDPELRMTKYTDELFPPADTLVKYMEDYVDRYDLKIKYNSKVEKIKKREPSGFQLELSSGEVYQCDILLMACGAMKEIIPDIPGKELAKKYSEHSINQEDYTNRIVCVVGGGNSGFETADHLAGHAAVVHVMNASLIRMAWDTHFPGNLRAINNSIIDMFHLKSLHALRLGDVKKIEEVDIEGRGKMLKLWYDMPLPHWNPPSTAHFHILYDDIIFCCGWRYVVPEMFDKSCMPDITPCGKYATLKPNWESTNVPNMYFLGTCTQQRDRRAASAFIHGFRYSVRALMHMLEFQRHSVPLPMKPIDSLNFDMLADFIIKRVSTTSALYQLNYGVLCDILVFEPGFAAGEKKVEDGPNYPCELKYYYEVPKEWALQQEVFKRNKSFWIIILKDHRSSFPKTMQPTDFAMPPDLKLANQPCSGFIGPIIFRYENGECVEEYNLGGNLIVRADQPQLQGDNGPVRAQNKLKNLMCRQLGISGEKFDESLYTEENYNAWFEHWSEERIMQEQKKEQMDSMNSCKLFRLNGMQQQEMASM